MPAPTVFKRGLAVDSTGVTLYDLDLVGIRKPGNALTAQCGVWSSAGPVTLTYAWYRGENVIEGADRSRYVVTLDDATFALSCVITATSPSGYATATSNAVLIPANAPVAQAPRNSAAPVIAGTGSVGEVLTLTRAGLWEGVTYGYTYVWMRDDVVIAGATGVTYTLAVADVGLLVSCAVTAHNSVGPTTVESNTIGPVAL